MKFINFISIFVLSCSTKQNVDCRKIITNEYVKSDSGLTPSLMIGQTIGFIENEQPVCLSEIYSEIALKKVIVGDSVTCCRAAAGYPPPGQPNSPWTDPKSPWRDQVDEYYGP